MTDNFVFTEKTRECAYCQDKDCYKLKCSKHSRSMGLCLSCIENFQKPETECLNCLSKNCPFKGYLSGSKKIAIDRRDFGVVAFADFSIPCAFDDNFYKSVLNIFFNKEENKNIEIIILRLNLNLKEVEALKEFGFEQSSDKPEIWYRNKSSQK